MQVYLKPLDDHDPSVDEYIKYTFEIPSKADFMAQTLSDANSNTIYIALPIYNYGTVTIDWKEDDVRFYHGSFQVRTLQHQIILTQ